MISHVSDIILRNLERILLLNFSMRLSF